MPDMIATGFICALLTHKAVARVTGHYRRQLADANQALEGRVRERTAELEQALATQTALRDELMVRDRMATAGMLAAGVSHEIRLTAVGDPDRRRRRHRDRRRGC